MHVYAVLNNFWARVMRRDGYTSDGYLWQLEYRDTVRLLQEKLILFVRMNEKLRGSIRDKQRFVNNTAEAIELNLGEFSESYRAKWIDGDPEKYCQSFIELLTPVLTRFVMEIGYGAHGFKFRFRYNGRVIENSKTIFRMVPGGEDQRA